MVVLDGSLELDKIFVQRVVTYLVPNILVGSFCVRAATSTPGKEGFGICTPYKSFIYWGTSSTLGISGKTFALVQLPACIEVMSLLQRPWPASVQRLSLDRCYKGTRAIKGG